MFPSKKTKIRKKTPDKLCVCRGLVRSKEMVSGRFLNRPYDELTSLCVTGLSLLFFILQLLLPWG